MKTVNRISLSVFTLWLFISVLPFILWGKMGFHFWAIYNRFIGVFVEKYISEDFFIMVFFTSILNAAILFLVFKFIGGISIKLYHKYSKTCDR